MDIARKGELEQIALEVRKDIVRMAGVARARGPEAALSAADLLVYLYWEQMKVFPEERRKPDRDRLVLSGGSAAPALYACLARRGFFGRDELWNYRRLGGTLQGYPDIRTPGVDAPGGTSGLGVALGLCLAQRIDGMNGRVFCVMDGVRFYEGAVWESLFAAASQGLSNLFLVVEVSGNGRGGRYLRYDDEKVIGEKLVSFGWSFAGADGNDFESLEGAFQNAVFSGDSPRAVIARTRKDMPHNASLTPGMSEKRLTRDDIETALSQLESKASRRSGPE